MLQMSRAIYYRHWLVSRPLEADTAIRGRLQSLALEDRHCGYRRLTQKLNNEGVIVNHKRVLRLMREDNLLCLRKKAFVPATTNSKHSWQPRRNLARGMQTTGLNQLWVADITYIRLRQEHVYAAVVLDAHSRRVIGWSLESHLEATLAIRALQMAIERRKPKPGMIHHSDRGIQYACADYAEVLTAAGIQGSMSRVGNPYDNAKAESFMKTLKQEEVNGKNYKNLNDLRERLEEFFEVTYNQNRLHSSLGYLSPNQFESEAGS
jgi:putative transposase